MMIRRIFVTFLIIMLTISSGCWDRRELDDLGIVNGIGIESAPGGKIRIIAQTLNTSAIVRGTGGGGAGTTFQKAYRNTVAEGNSLQDAIDNLTKVTPIQRFFSHNSVVIVSEELARKQGIRSIMDFLERNPELRLDPWLIIGRGSLVSLMDQPGRITLIPSQRIDNYMKIHKISSTYAPLNVGQFIRSIQSPCCQPYTAVIETGPNESLSDEPGHDLASGVVPEPLNQIIVNGTAVFKEDKMVGWLNAPESRGLLWVRGEVEQGYINFSIPGEQDRFAETSILRSSSKLEPSIKDGQIMITATIKVDTYLIEVQGNIDPGITEELKKLEDAQDAEISKEIKAALKKAQGEYHADIFGFGAAIHRGYPAEWKQLEAQWDEAFPGLQVEIKVESSIRHTSLINKPAEAARQ